MANYFFDSSGLVKRYNSKIGSACVLQIYRHSSKNIIHIAQISLVEVTSALTRRLKGKLNYQQTLKRFERDVQNRFVVSKINDKIISEAVKLAKKHSLRGYDAVQLAVSIEIEIELISLGFPSLIFVSADNELNIAAQAENLVVENPNNYP